MSGSNAAAESVASAPTSSARHLLAAARPRQWVKNLLVFAAPAASGGLFEMDVGLRAVGAFVAFCLVASGVYFLNDVRDVEEDRLHPRKRERPIAAGLVSPVAARATGISLLVTGALLAARTEPRLLVVLAVYLIITSAYTFGVKRVAVVELGAVSSGFILRAVAGGVAASVPISAWFLIVTSFASLFMVAGKRQGEFIHMGEARGDTRQSLRAYTLGYLRSVWVLSASVTVTAYCLWAFEQSEASGGSVPLHEISIAPFVLALLKYALTIEAGDAGAPEEVVLADRAILGAGLVWAVLYGAAVYG